MPTYNKICIVCGKEFIANGNNAKRCKVCRKLRSKELQAIYFKRDKSSLRIRNIKPKKPKKPTMSISEVLSKMEAYNKEHNTCLTYGQFIQIKDRRVKNVKV